MTDPGKKTQIITPVQDERGGGGGGGEVLSFYCSDYVNSTGKVSCLHASKALMF